MCIGLVQYLVLIRFYFKINLAYLSCLTRATQPLKQLLLGCIAQLVERYPYKVDVGGSNPLHPPYFHYKREILSDFLFV